MKKNFYKIQYGFTLIEVLIALLILAIALIAVTKATQDSIRDTARVQDRIIAQWVGLNVISRMQIGLISPPKIDSASENTVKMMNQNWRWRAAVVSGVSEYERITVSVYRQGEKSQLAKLTGFINITKENENDTTIKS